MGHGAPLLNINCTLELAAAVPEPVAVRVWTLTYTCPWHRAASKPQLWHQCVLSLHIIDLNRNNPLVCVPSQGCVRRRKAKQGRARARAAGGGGGVAPGPRSSVCGCGGRVCV